MINLEVLDPGRADDHPYRWAQMTDLIDPRWLPALEREFPLDHYRIVKGDDGEKTYSYAARPMVSMDGGLPFHDHLSPAWRRLTEQVASTGLAARLSDVVDLDISQAPMECNAHRYGPGDDLGPHTDLPIKIVTLVVYFTPVASGLKGGDFLVLDGQDATRVVAAVPATSGNAVTFRRADNSWHAVAPVARDSGGYRQTLTITFYQPGSKSSMWPEGEHIPLVDAPTALGR